MKKKVISLLMATITVTTLLAGCGTAETNSVKDSNSIEVSAAPAADSAGDAAGATTNTRKHQTSNAMSATAVDEINFGGAVEEYCEADEYYYDEYPGWEPEYDPNFNTEEYNANNENSFCSVVTTPLSTFGADVDTASYSNFRRFVTNGYDMDQITAGSIRTEEMVNYFSYDYERPEDGQVFAVDATISNCPWNKKSKVMTVGVNTDTIDRDDMPASNIVFLVDVSGSMSSANKLPLIQSTIDEVIDQFGENDRISIVTYANGTEVVLNGAEGDKHRKIKKAFDGLESAGGTNGGDGIVLAYETAEENFIEDGINRVIIMSDGDFNVGLSSESELKELITKEKETGIFLSTLGFGMGNYSDVTMETLADSGNGNYAYIDTRSEARKVLVEEMTQNFTCIAKDVKLQVEFNPSVVSSYRLIGYENRSLAAEDFKDDTKDGGEMGAGHQVTAVYELVLADDADEMDSDLKYQETELSKKGKAGDEYCTVSIAYKEPDADKSQYLEFPIDVDNYEKKPNDNFIWAVSVAELSLALKDSEYLGDFTPEEALEDVYDTVSEMDDLDEYQEEFIELVDELYSYL